jgi:uncharacterized membrane protein HdeD (DUF308 family)
MKRLIFSNWHFMRFLRVALALFLFVQAYITHEWFFIVFGIFFLVQAIFNLGCGADNCNVNFEKNDKI